MGKLFKAKAVFIDNTNFNTLPIASNILVIIACLFSLIEKEPKVFGCTVTIKLHETSKPATYIVTLILLATNIQENSSISNKYTKNA